MSSIVENYTISHHLPYTNLLLHRTLNLFVLFQIKLDGEGKMPFVNWRGENYTCNTPSSNCTVGSTSDDEELCKTNNTSTMYYTNLKTITKDKPTKPVTIVQEEPKSSLPYANLVFANSLEYYENSRTLLQNAQHTKAIANTENKITNSCSKCGHCQGRAESKSKIKNDDYLSMEPTVNPSGQRLQNIISSPPRTPERDQEYLHMLPISKKSEELLNLRASQLNSKSHSIPILPVVRPKGVNSLHNPSLCHSISESNSPYPRRRLLTCVGTPSQKEFLAPSIRRRSSSMDSSKYLDPLERIEEKVASPTRTLVNTPTISNATSIDSLSDLSFHQRPIPTSSSEHGLSKRDHSEYVLCNSTLKSSCEASTKKNHNSEVIREDLIEQCLPTSHIKRSASIPCKSVYNRDSSGSNDSGVSTGSLQFRKRDLMELDFHSMRRGALREYKKSSTEKVLNKEVNFGRSKSVDPFEDVNFLFDELKLPVKSSSAGATVPVCTVRNVTKGKSVADTSLFAMCLL